MSDESKKSLSKIRTFAQDVEAQKKKDGTDSPSTSTPTVARDTASHTEKPIVVKEPIQIKEASAHVPAFHELHKKPESTIAMQTTTAVKTSFVVPPLEAAVPVVQKTVVPLPPKKQEKIIRVQSGKTAKKIVRDGVIITDNKNNKISFLPAVLASFDAWVKNISQTFKRKAPPTYTVTDTQRRKGVIQKATSKTGSIFTADNETLKEQIRRRQAQAELEEKSEIFWSPKTESGYALLTATKAPATKPANVQVAFKKRATPTITVVEPTTIIQPETPKSGFEDSIEIPFTPTPTTPSDVIPQTTTIVEERLPLPIEPEAPEPITQDMAPAPVQRKLPFTFPGINVLRQLNTNVLTISIVGFISGLLLTIYIVGGVVNILFPEVVQPTNVISAQPILKDVSVNIVTIPALTRGALKQALEEAPQTNGTTSESIIVGTTGEPVSAQTILAFLAFNTNPNLNQNITEMHFGMALNEPIVLLAVSDNTTVFGALLEWEPLMARDISGLLNLPPATTTNRFYDRTLGTTDVRVLEIGGSEVLVYGFIAENIVAITPSTNAFQALISTQ